MIIINVATMMLSFVILGLCGLGIMDEIRGLIRDLRYAKTVMNTPYNVQDDETTLDPCAKHLEDANVIMGKHMRRKCIRDFCEIMALVMVVIFYVSSHLVITYERLSPHLPTLFQFL